ncbi:Swt1 family HEPN domain-containing protein [Aromatoleum toluclasticum]|uniref:Swt1 family HEPN domain-containing protein n=1 Tax=Aromatoleum toluclasticum TaxID=92003 RepID=UPI00036F2168|nr:Swt1 family HEPN domain-containing protein [Aromatoleum toluclasticum]
MEWKSAEVSADGVVKIPQRWLHLYYYEALNILFRFENALRLFVYVVLKNKLGKDWDAAALGDGITIRTETKKRIAQAREHGYLGYEVSSPMLYLNSGELTQIISSDAYWKHFAPYFRATKAVVLTKLQEIGTVRNSLAHFRPIKQDDIDLIKQNSRHVLLEIEKCLAQITAITDVVPTNSSANWYKELKAIGSETLRTGLFSSVDQDWGRLELEYQVPLLQKTLYGHSYVAYRLGSIRTPQVLARYDSLRNRCIYVSESPIHGAVPDDKNLQVTKGLSIVFSCEALEAGLAEVVDAVKDIAIITEQETALIRQDNLARGELVEVKEASAILREGVNNTKYWASNLESLSTSPAEIEAVEYWGQRWHYSTDFVSSVAQYPWMPSTVSSQEWPF